MTCFAENVFEVFDLLTSKHRFVRAKAAAGKRFASLVRQETDDVFVYVFVHDGRPSNANVTVDIWAAPPESPDHSLEKLYVGYKVQIGSAFNIDDGFFQSCQCRIIQFLPCISHMVPSVCQELSNPCFLTRRWTVYQIERQSLASLLTRATQGDLGAVTAIETARRLANGKGTLRKLEEISRPLAATLLEERVLGEDALRVFEGNVQSLASTLASHLYIRALGELSLNR